MSIVLRILMLIGAVSLLIFMLKRIRQSKLKIEYAVFWIVFAAVLVFMSLFPFVFYWISDLIGFQSPINMIYLVIIFILIVKLFLTSLQISQLENKIDNLVQKIAIEKRLSEEKEEKDTKETV